MIATVSRDGKFYQQVYSQGKALADVEEIGTSTSTGTKVFFQPDEAFSKNWFTIMIL
jgi:DNA gyrase subunit B